MVKYCDNCNFEILEGTNFCTYCGAEIQHHSTKDHKQSQNGKITDNQPGFRHYTSLLNYHVRRMKDDSPENLSFINQYLKDEQLEVLTSIAMEKMKLSLSDGKQHAFGFTAPPVCYCIWTLPMEIDKARDWIASTYGGFGVWLKRTQDYPVIKKQDCKVFCHIVYGGAGNDKTIWIQIGIWPIIFSDIFKNVVLPKELLTPQEQRIVKDFIE